MNELGAGEGAEVTVRPKSIVATSIIAVEALYFIGATAIVTSFGISIAQGDAGDSGSELASNLLRMSSLPLVAVGAFALWALALTHVLPIGGESAAYAAGASQRMRRSGSADRAKTAGASHVASMLGFLIVVALHVVVGVSFLGTGQYVPGCIMLGLALALFFCSYRQYKAGSKALSGRYATA